MTTAKNTFVNDSFLTAEVPNQSGNTFNQGDMLYANSVTSYQATGLSTVANSPYFIGVANDTSPIPNNYTNQPNLPVNVIARGRVALIAKNGDTFQPYFAVWPAAIDNQTVTVTSGNANPIGFVANTVDTTQSNFVGTGSNTIIIDVRAQLPVR